MFSSVPSHTCVFPRSLREKAHIHEEPNTNSVYLKRHFKELLLVLFGFPYKRSHLTSLFVTEIKFQRALIKEM
jgi:hypothetical protein